MYISRQQVRSLHYHRLFQVSIYNNSFNTQLPLHFTTGISQCLKQNQRKKHDGISVWYGHPIIPSLNHRQAHSQDLCSPSLCSNRPKATSLLTLSIPPAQTMDSGSVCSTLSHSCRPLLLFVSSVTHQDSLANDQHSLPSVGSHPPRRWMES